MEEERKSFNYASEMKKEYPASKAVANDGPRRPEDVPLKRRDVKDKDDTISNNKDLKNALKIGS